MVRGLTHLGIGVSHSNLKLVQNRFISFYALKCDYFRCLIHNFYFCPHKTNQVIPGLDQGVSQLSIGERAKIIMPSTMAYGPKGFPGL